jgi:hypothetical protein
MLNFIKRSPVFALALLLSCGTALAEENIDNGKVAVSPGR